MISNDDFIAELNSTPKKVIVSDYKDGMYDINRYTPEQLLFIERNIVYPIGNRESINCSCGCHRGFIIEFEYEDNIVQNTVCMLCSAVVNVDKIQGDISADERALLTFLDRF
jgi:hypothetical protein